MEKLINTINTLVSGLGKQDLDTSLPNRDILQQAINDLQTFGQEYETYFEQIIAEKAYDPTRTTEIRLRHQYTQTLQSYWTPLEQVVLQWRVEFYRHMLEQAHDQSKYYLEKLGLPISGLLIYFNKVVSIRYLPFTRIPILGIPYAFSAPERWSAIPHEIGHYVFWNLGDGFRRTRQLQEQLKDEAEKYLTESGVDEGRKKFVMPWLEEVFSDVAGTRVDGLNFVSSSDEFIRSQAGNEDELTMNDGHHPPLSIRPFVWGRALKSMTKKVDTPTRDQIFGSFLGINVKELRIKFPIPLLSEEHAAGMGMLSDNQKFESLSVGELLPATEKLVEYLSGKLDGIIASLPSNAGKRSSFQELKKFLEDEQPSSEESEAREIYELLLKPRILEGGITHTHGIYLPFHGWHESTTHSH